jgi:hypothetical protein
VMEGLYSAPRHGRSVNQSPHDSDSSTLVLLVRSTMKDGFRVPERAGHRPRRQRHGDPPASRFHLCERAGTPTSPRRTAPVNHHYTYTAVPHTALTSISPSSARQEKVKKSMRKQAEVGAEQYRLTDPWARRRRQRDRYDIETEGKPREARCCFALLAPPSLPPAPK